MNNAKRAVDLQARTVLVVLFQITYKTGNAGINAEKAISLMIRLDSVYRAKIKTEDS